MRKRRTVILLGTLAVGCVFLAMCISVRTSPEEERMANFKYFRDVLGPIVLQYATRHGHAPLTFEEAHQESGVRLSHRGDAFGNGFVYRRIADDCFCFVTPGWDSDPKAAAGPWVVVRYMNGKWSNYESSSVPGSSTDGVPVQRLPY